MYNYINEFVLVLFYEIIYLEIYIIDVVRLIIWKYFNYWQLNSILYNVYNNINFSVNFGYVRCYGYDINLLKNYINLELLNF